MTAFAGAKTETVEQAKQIGIAVNLVEAVVHGGSQEGQCLARVFQVHLGHIMARLFDSFVTFVRAQSAALYRWSATFKNAARMPITLTCNTHSTRFECA
ncbi:Pr70.3 [Pseudomonas sp. Os17]|nr:Pr70.3 [Pseudomonas sp. Os17]BAQ82498.1 Pr70.3 [Pseudomonas sp. St29]